MSKVRRHTLPTRKWAFSSNSGAKARASGNNSGDEAPGDAAS
eukprot:CAMPEP_0172878088 /NCGR_PEP_ID=MMETSP1075-20121228/108716_1 /TAXON_ID=2916 /ORGANISM="Ceratium fusus, Strain PA161109" /LENGTH=41 /DNA_ID= /DNA_START= /DNA_END= /DNA_ORIENTATION=